MKAVFYNAVYCCGPQKDNAPINKFCPGCLSLHDCRNTTRVSTTGPRKPFARVQRVWGSLRAKSCFPPSVLRDLFLTLVVRYLVEPSTTTRTIVHIPLATKLFFFSPFSFFASHWCMMLTACWEVSSLDLITLKTFHCFTNQSRLLDHTAVLAFGGSREKTSAIVEEAPFCATFAELGDNLCAKPKLLSRDN